MREIKFRAWEEKYKCMYYNHSVSIAIDGTISFCGRDGNWNEIEEGQLILMQYTGLKDKNGKDIYEGDVVHLKEGYGTKGGVWHVFQDDYGTGYFSRMMEPFKGASISFKEYYTKHPNDSFEIIGNIYENPELLNSDQEDKRSVATGDPSSNADDTIK